MALLVYARRCIYEAKRNLPQTNSVYEVVVVGNVLDDHRALGIVTHFCISPVSHIKVWASERSC